LLGTAQPARRTTERKRKASPCELASFFLALLRNLEPIRSGFFLHPLVNRLNFAVMKRLRLTLCLLIFIPGCSLLAGMASMHTGSNTAIQMVLGGIIGLFFGLMFGGAEGKSLNK